MAACLQPATHRDGGLALLEAAMVACWVMLMSRSLIVQPSGASWWRCRAADATVATPGATAAKVRAST
jgi:hypothetical protein